MSPYLFLLLALWPLVCCGDSCPRTPVCIACSIVVALAAFAIAQVVRELWLLRIFRNIE
ncbi:MAG: hypothetical protein ABI831_08165 [Betaproteobacteria bacterium]